jgi:hypothetical protein
MQDLQPEERIGAGQRRRATHDSTSDGPHEPGRTFETSHNTIQTGK